MLTNNHKLGCPLIDEYNPHNLECICAEDSRMNKHELKALYASLLPKVSAEAKLCGYAIGEHGSMTRDMDLMAFAWTEDALSEGELILRICMVVNGRLLGGYGSKPHGRHAYTIVLDDYKSDTDWAVFLDISVAPRI